MAAGRWLGCARLLVGVIGAAVAANGADARSPVHDPAAVPTIWRMIVDNDGKPTFVPQADLAAAGAQAGIRRLHVLTTLLPKRDGSGRSGWMVATEDYD